MILRRGTRCKKGELLFKTEREEGRAIYGESKKGTKLRINKPSKIETGVSMEKSRRRRRRGGEREKKQVEETIKHGG